MHSRVDGLIGGLIAVFVIWVATLNRRYDPREVESLARILARLAERTEAGTKGASLFSQFAGCYIRGLARAIKDAMTSL
jgi:hypothetical protein